MNVITFAQMVGEQPGAIKPKLQQKCTFLDLAHGLLSLQIVFCREIGALALFIFSFCLQSSLEYLHQNLYCSKFGALQHPTIHDQAHGVTQSADKCIDLQ